MLLPCIESLRLPKYRSLDLRTPIALPEFACSNAISRRATSWVLARPPAVRSDPRTQTANSFPVLLLSPAAPSEPDRLLDSRKSAHPFCRRSRCRCLHLHRDQRSETEFPPLQFHLRIENIG